MDFCALCRGDKLPEHALGLEVEPGVWLWLLFDQHAATAKETRVGFLLRSNLVRHFPHPLHVLLEQSLRFAVILQDDDRLVYFCK